MMPKKGLTNSQKKGKMSAKVELQALLGLEAHGVSRTDPQALRLPRYTAIANALREERPGAIDREAAALGRAMEILIGGS
jgi:hypothetical protein